MDWQSQIDSLWNLNSILQRTMKISPHLSDIDFITRKFILFLINLKEGANLNPLKQVLQKSGMWIVACNRIAASHIHTLWINNTYMHFLFSKKKNIYFLVCVCVCFPMSIPFSKLEQWKFLYYITIEQF